MKHSKYLIICTIICIYLVSCIKDVTHFGFDGSLSGEVKDLEGNIVAGDITTNSLFVQTLEEGSSLPILIRVKGDGTFQNTKLFPVKHKMWITGALETQGPDTIEVDYATKKIQKLDFVVTPFLTIKTPRISDSNPTSVNIEYDIKGNLGHVADIKNIYCGTYSYPNSTIGSGWNYKTIVIPLSDDKGMQIISGLESNTKYFIRVGAKARGSDYENFSEQISITTP